MTWFKQADSEAIDHALNEMGSFLEMYTYKGEPGPEMDLENAINAAFDSGNDQVKLEVLEECLGYLEMMEGDERADEIAGYIQHALAGNQQPPLPGLGPQGAKKTAGDLPSDSCMLCGHERHHHHPQGCVFREGKGVCGCTHPDYYSYDIEGAKKPKKKPKEDPFDICRYCGHDRDMHENVEGGCSGIGYGGKDCGCEERDFETSED